jgi:hypothetical protein
MHGPINVKSPNNISKQQMGFNAAFKGLIQLRISLLSSANINNEYRPWNADSAFLKPFHYFRIVSRIYVPNKLQGHCATAVHVQWACLSVSHKTRVSNLLSTFTSCFCVLHENICLLQLKYSTTVKSILIQCCILLGFLCAMYSHYFSSLTRSPLHGFGRLVS